jgi:hypothetical protein
MAKKALILAVALISLLALASILFLVQLTRTKSAERDSRQALRAAEAARLAQEQQSAQRELEREPLARQNKEFNELTSALRLKAAPSSNTPAPGVPAGDSSIQPQSESPATPPPESGGMAALMRKMMADPAMKEMMRSQQRTVMAKMYAPLFKELNLPPEQRDKFMGLLLDNAMGSVVQAGDLLQGQSAERTDALNAIQERQKEMNQGMKGLLGAENFARYEQYQKTLAERSQLNSFREELAEGPSPLQDSQAAQLMSILAEEKARVPSVLGGGSEAVGSNLSALGSPETMNQHFQWQEDLNRRVLERAKETLNPPQLAAYGAFLRQQLETQKLGVKMAQDLFGGPRAGGGAPAPGVDVIPVPAKP